MTRLFISAPGSTGDLNTLRSQYRVPIDYIWQSEPPGWRHPSVPMHLKIVENTNLAHPKANVEFDEQLMRQNERLRERLLEEIELAHAWQRQHDILLGWIQARPEVLRDLIATDPRPPAPRPFDISELRRVERDRCAAIVRRYRDAAGDINSDAFTIVDAILREIEEL